MAACLFFFASGSLFVACTDEKSANNSTTETEVKETPDSTMDPAGPAVAKTKRSGKVSSKMEADDTKVAIEKDNMGYYNRADVLPAYNGGERALEDYIVNNIEYPQDALDNNIEGVVRVQFGVDENGNISNVSTVGNKIGYGLEEEAIRVVSRMPKWTPGQIKGKNVKTWRTLPINYRLEET
jgi:TonB family protein